MKVLIVDDSRIFRKQVELAFEELEDIEIVGSVWSGDKALSVILEKKPDLVTLDQEMPGMDGLSTLVEIQKLNRAEGLNVIVVMLSSHTQRGGEVTMKALAEGALDFIAKPSGPDAEANRESLVSQLREKVEACRCGGRRSKMNAHSVSTVTSSLDSELMTEGVVKGKAGDVNLIAIGISTGGPKALQVLLPRLCELTILPIVVVQHMPPHFTKSLAESLDKVCSHKVIEVSEETIIESKYVYIAPGGHHLMVRMENLTPILRLGQQDPENGFRPSADVLFRSVAATCKDRALGVIMTGMGSDGVGGLKAMKRQGATIIAQDQASSVVWGMPGSAVNAGVVDRVVALDEMPGVIQEYCLKGD